MPSSEAGARSVPEANTGNYLGRISYAKYRRMNSSHNALHRHLYRNFHSHATVGDIFTAHMEYPTYQLKSTVTQHEDTFTLMTTQLAPPY